MQPTVLLFDIDGTLVTTGGAGRRAMQRSFDALYGRPDAMDFVMDGMTDLSIARRALEAVSVEATLTAMQRVLDGYLRALEEEVARVPDAEYRVHRGMHAALDAARAQGAAIGLGTGNVRDGARLKLSRVALYECFMFGGFGCDAEDRAALLRIGAERGAARLGRELAACRVVVIGDTPKDIAAAQRIGAESVGVGTGRYSKEELLASGASFAFDDLASTGALVALLGMNS